ncbi:MAG: hypothetical protein QM235_10565 [Pseudomonadota bacterium]|nr:hypothetical protein [Pseudomonadota bacterium]
MEKNASAIESLQGKEFLCMGETLTIWLERYAISKRPAVELLCTDDGVTMPYGTLTVNMPEVQLADDEIIIKNWSENEWLASAALKSGLFEDTGRRIPTGFVEAPVWKVKS